METYVYTLVYHTYTVTLHQVGTTTQLQVLPHTTYQLVNVVVNYIFLNKENYTHTIFAKHDTIIVFGVIVRGSYLLARATVPRGLRSGRFNVVTYIGPWCFYHGLQFFVFFFGVGQTRLL